MPETDSITAMCRLGGRAGLDAGKVFYAGLERMRAIQAQADHQLADIAQRGAEDIAQVQDLGGLFAAQQKILAEHTRCLSQYTVEMMRAMLDNSALSQSALKNGIEHWQDRCADVLANVSLTELMPAPFSRQAANSGAKPATRRAA